MSIGSTYVFLCSYTIRPTRVCTLCWPCHQSFLLQVTCLHQWQMLHQFIFLLNFTHGVCVGKNAVILNEVKDSGNGPWIIVLYFEQVILQFLLTWPKYLVGWQWCEPCRYADSASSFTFPYLPRSYRDGKSTIVRGGVHELALDRLKSYSHESPTDTASHPLSLPSYLHHRRPSKRLATVRSKLHPLSNNINQNVSGEDRYLERINTRAYFAPSTSLPTVVPPSPHVNTNSTSKALSKPSITSGG